MTAYANLPALDPNRWDWSWQENTPRRILTDALADTMAGRQSRRLNDYQHVDPSILPFLAYQLNAIAFDTGGTDQSQRRALEQAASILASLGSEGAYYALLEINRCAGYHLYRPAGKPKTGVELFITPPVDRGADMEFISYISDRSRRVWPHTLAVIAVHILTVSELTLTQYGVMTTSEFSGNYPYGA